MWKPRICICPSLARPAVPAAPRLPGCRQLRPGLWGPRAGRERKGTEQLSRRRGKERGWAQREFAHSLILLDTRQILWPSTSKSESGPPQCQEPAAAEAMSAQAGQPGRSGKTHSMAGLPGPDRCRGRWSTQRPPALETNQAHVGADSTALAGCRVIPGGPGGLTPCPEASG